MTTPAEDITLKNHGSCGRAARRRAGVALGLILLAAAGVRFYGIGHEALWTDEAASLRAARGGWYDVLRQYHEYENTPPLYYLLLHGVGELFGTASDVVVRAPSAVFGILAIVFTWALTRRCLAEDGAPPAQSTAAPILSAGLAALSIQQVYFSQEARAYSMFAALAILSSICLLRAIERHNAARYSAYILATVAMNYTHFAAAGVLIAQFACGCVAVARRGNRERFAFVASQFAIALLTLPLLPTALKTRGRMLGIDERTLLSALERFAGTFTWLCGSAWLFVPIGLLIVWGLLRSSIAAYRKVLILGLIVLPPVVPLVGWYTGGAQYFARHALPSGLAMAVATAIGLAALPRRAPWPVASILLAGAAVVFGLNRHQLRKPAMREAAQFVSAHAKPGDTVVVSLMMAGWSFDRYFDRTDLRRRNYDEFTVKHVATSGDGINRVWLVFNPLPPDEAALMKDSPLRVVGRHEFFDVRVLELQRPQ